jgi:hypothetical protein
MVLPHQHRERREAAAAMISHHHSPISQWKLFGSAQQTRTSASQCRKRLQTRKKHAKKNFSDIFAFSAVYIVLFIPNAGLRSGMTTLASAAIAEKDSGPVAACTSTQTECKQASRLTSHRMQHNVSDSSDKATLQCLPMETMSANSLGTSVGPQAPALGQASGTNSAVCKSFVLQQGHGDGEASDFASADPGEALPRTKHTLGSLLCW